jgi:aminoglycoside phosphotransferase family enzyme/predicted kinase
MTGRMKPDRSAQTAAAVASWLSAGGPFGSDVKPRRVDTHAASLFFTQDRAWKLKRPVQMGYLDFSTVAKRRAALAAELRLNRRTAPDFYLGLHRITRSSGILSLDGPGEVVDYILEMKRFPDNALLADRASQGSLPDWVWQRLAQNILQFHASQKPQPCSEGAVRLQKIVEGNAESMARFPQYLDSKTAEILTTSHLAAIGRNRGLLELRARDGRVRHVHGDLHLGNIALIDGEPTLFDCLEFDADLATTDLFYDLAFLLMDLWERGLRHEANIVFNYYLDRAPQDEAALVLLPLFMSVRATVRGHVMAAQASDCRGDNAAERARGYQTLARELMNWEVPPLVAIGGLSGTGKSTLARDLGGDLGHAPGARILRSDVLRKRLARVAPETRLDAKSYTPERSIEVYAELSRLAHQALLGGQAVIADAVYGHATEREAIEAVAGLAGCAFTGIWLKLGEMDRIARIVGRSLDASDADADVARSQTATLSQEAPEWLQIDAGGDLATMKKKVIERLA